MAALGNFFALLGDEESDALAIVHRAAAAAAVAVASPPDKPPSKKQEHLAPPKLPSKPLPPSQAVKESKFSQLESGRGRGARGGGRGSFGSRDKEREGGFNRAISGGFQGDRGSYSDRSNSYHRDGNDFQGGRGGFYGRGGGAPYGAPGNDSSFGEDGEVGHNFERGRGRGRGRTRGRGYGEGADNFRRGYRDGLSGEQQPRRRVNERSGTGPGNGFKRDDTGGGNWGAETEHGAPEELQEIGAIKEETHETEVVEKHETEVVEKPAGDTKAESATAEEKKTEEAEPATAEEKKTEEEDNEMLLEDYYKMLNEKRKNLNTSRSEERKVIVDKDFEGMQLMNKKQEDGTLLKLGSEKDKGKKKEISDREGKTMKSVSINEFLRPVGGEEYYSPGGRRGRGRGRSDRGGYRVGFGGSYSTARQPLAPHIEDPGQFPILAVK